jgi:hypothetical protein
MLSEIHQNGGPVDVCEECTAVMTLTLRRVAGTQLLSFKYLGLSGELTQKG